jgi:hypothetical protein
MPQSNLPLVVQSVLDAGRAGIEHAGAVKKITPRADTSDIRVLGRRNSGRLLTLDVLALAFSLDQVGKFLFAGLFGFLLSWSFS